MAEVVEAAEAVEEAAAEVVEVLRGIPPRYAVIGGALLAGVGGVVGWFMAERKYRKAYEAKAETEIEQMRDHFRQRLLAKEVKPEISSLGKTVQELGYAPTPPEPPAAPGDINTAAGVEEQSEVSNVFQREAEHEDHWDYEEEKKTRDPSYPYVIHIDERGETGYEEITLTYYSGDDVICDHQDKIVDDKERVVGEKNILKFGHGSGDPAVVYIRNEYLDLDIELVRSEQSYAEEVHGITHADSPRRRERPQWR